MYGPEAVLGQTGTPATSTSVNVYLKGTTTPASLFTDQTGTVSASNPVATDSYGNLAFFATPGAYDLAFTIGGVATTLTVRVDPWPTDVGFNERVVTGTDTASASDFIIGDVHTAGFTETVAPILNARYKIKRKADTGANVLTVAASSGVILGPGCGGSTGLASIPLGSNDAFVELLGDGTNLQIVGGALDTGWMSTVSAFCTLGSGWTNTNLQMRQQGNLVRFAGALGVGTSGTTCFTINAAYRPSAAGNGGYWPVQPINGNAPGSGGSVTINTSNGVATCYYAPSAAYVEFNGLSYLVD
jgi:hypothetical protein